MTAAAGAYGGFTDPWEALRRLKDQARAAGMSGRGRGPWGGWGGPPPWVAWGGHGFGGGRPRAAKGNVRTAILALLWEGPRHGYQLMQDIAERSNGEWRPSPGSIYPVLSALQDEGLVDDEKVEGKRVFTLTESGRAHVQERADELSTVFDAFAADAEAPEEADVKALLVDVASAAVQVMRSGTPAQVADAKVILAQVRRDLYRVLAEEQE
jgi:DNA-binding PadR family transcriptional regulator